MKSSFLALVSLALCALVTSCYPPYPPIERPLAPAPELAPTESSTATAGDRAQKQLEAARERLREEERRSGNNTSRTARNSSSSNSSSDSDNSSDSSVSDNSDSSSDSGDKETTTTYKYATKVEGKAGYVHNPYTQNQVDVRGIPSGTLVRDPHDPNPAHKFRVP